MRPVVICLSLMLCIYLPMMYVEIPGASGQIDQVGLLPEPKIQALQQDKEKELRQEDAMTAMEALEIIKEIYADNFVKRENASGEGYFYKLPFAEYYLVYEGQGETEEEYLFHLYEYVLDDPEEGIGHTVTYGWYRVNRVTGDIKDE